MHLSCTPALLPRYLFADMPHFTSCDYFVALYLICLVIPRVDGGIPTRCIEWASIMVDPIKCYRWGSEPYRLYVFIYRREPSTWRTKF